MCHYNRDNGIHDCWLNHICVCVYMCVCVYVYVVSAPTGQVRVKKSRGRWKILCYTTTRFQYITWQLKNKQEKKKTKEQTNKHRIIACVLYIHDTRALHIVVGETHNVGTQRPEINDSFLFFLSSFKLFLFVSFIFVRLKILGYFFQVFECSIYI